MSYKWWQRDVKTAYEFHPDHLDQRSFAKIASNYWQWLSFITFFFQTSFYESYSITSMVMAPISSNLWLTKNLDLQTPRLGERPRFGKAMPFKLMKQALARQSGKNLMDWTGENTHLTGWENAQPMGFWEMLFIFFAWTKKSQFFFGVFLGALQCWCMSISGQHFRRLMYDFRFGIQMANVGSSMSDRLSSLKLCRCGNQKIWGHLNKGSFHHTSTNYTPPQNRIRISWGVINYHWNCNSDHLGGDTPEEAKTGGFTFDSPSPWGAFWTSFGGRRRCVACWSWAQWEVYTVYT